MNKSLACKFYLSIFVLLPLHCFYSGRTFWIHYVLCQNLRTATESCSFGACFLTSVYLWEDFIEKHSSLKKTLAHFLNVCPNTGLTMFDCWKRRYWKTASWWAVWLFRWLKLWLKFLNKKFQTRNRQENWEEFEWCILL